MFNENLAIFIQEKATGYEQVVLILISNGGLKWKLMYLLPQDEEI